MKTRPETRSGCSAASSSPRCAPVESATHIARSTAAGIHYVDRVLGELGLVVRRRLLRAVGAAVAARVEADDAEVTREVRDLRLPDARVHERPGRKEEDRLVAGAVGLPEHAHAVALDVPLLVGITGAAPVLRALLGVLPVATVMPSSSSRGDTSQRSIQSSSSPCPSSIPSRRSSANPWPKVMVIATSASTGNASPRPYSCGRAFVRLAQHSAPLGVHVRDPRTQIRAGSTRAPAAPSRSSNSPPRGPPPGIAMRSATSR